MEIPKQNFAQKLNVVEKAIKECDFMAIDTELSGNKAIVNNTVSFINTNLKVFIVQTSRLESIQWPIVILNIRKPLSALLLSSLDCVPLPGTNLQVAIFQSPSTFTYFQQAPLVKYKQTAFL